MNLFIAIAIWAVIIFIVPFINRRLSRGGWRAFIAVNIVWFALGVSGVAIVAVYSDDPTRSPFMVPALMLVVIPIVDSIRRVIKERKRKEERHG
ncbi:MAG: hypothetical protein LBL36_03010 [Clostridiales Family XIII bacterium]|jgi:hypothetical protein|nr:hypothetical protein [Clostridiales Family XIII bacterium]